MKKLRKVRLGPLFILLKKYLNKLTLLFLMKKRIIVIILALILIFSILGVYGYNKITGKAVSENAIPGIGPSSSDINCMSSCMKCVSPGVGCTGDSATCLSQCNVQKPEQTSEEKCVETCVTKSCSEFDFTCQARYQNDCDKECGMVKEPEAKNEEEQCIRDCVNSHASGTICKPSETGEQGNDVCQMCSKQCVHLYNGPCLDDAKLRAKENECKSQCEHCYGEPVMGDSGEGWECIVDMKCGDATSEFGDEPGTGEGIAVSIGNVFESIGNFFSNLFGGENTSEEPATSQE